MFMHEPVLLQEALTGLEIKPDGIYIDATFGRGGHAREILSRLSNKGRLLAIDQDLEAVNYAKTHFGTDERVWVRHGSFAQIQALATELGLQGRVDGILFDLGVSSPQLDNPERGFSFMRAGPLDMRMNTEAPMTAATFVNTAAEKTLVEVFQDYGEERFSRRIAKAIVLARQTQPIMQTQVLAEIVKAAHPRWEKHKHPATRVFQAIRIYINQELEDLKTGLKGALELLVCGGRMVVISFHSLEDRIVKQFMKKLTEGNAPPRGVPVRAAEIQVIFRSIGRAIKPTQEEMKRNVRARSAVMRVGEKLA
ncbi:MAG: 16S rRNA (cytosine(1402)-N(4))-methyltransferase RsmH [Gammaproteobacteria bacterium]|nr:16S rRNA (cytosine(1402)-N(4))-methyltransferase RsmH [Gammaproteobacteria bacterium]